MRLTAIKLRRILLSLLFCCCIAAFALIPSQKRPSSANSGPSSWSGITAIGTVYTDDNCPIVAENEVLTFDIPSFITYGCSLKEMQDYDSKFTADYSFKNPTNDSIKATLAFPLGNEYYDINCYDETTEQYIHLDDLKKDTYAVKANGKTLHASMRHTFIEYGSFDFATSSKRIKDDYSYNLFAPELAVNKYTLRFSFTSSESVTAIAKLDLSNPDARVAANFGYLDLNNKLRFFANDNENYDIYIIGGTIDFKRSSWSFIDDMNTNKRVDGSCEIIDSTTLSFKDFIKRNDESDVSDMDYYNAVCDFIASVPNERLPSDFSFLFDSQSQQIMRWLVYDLSFEAGETIINSVTAPLYSGGLYNYSPYVYTFNYLLSPAQAWNDFKSLEININTPHYLFSSVLPLEKTENGYAYRATALPEGELEFALSTSESPEYIPTPYNYIPLIIIASIGFVIAVIVSAIVLLTILLVKAANSRNNPQP